MSKPKDHQLRQLKQQIQRLKDRLNQKESLLVAQDELIDSYQDEIIELRQAQESAIKELDRAIDHIKASEFHDRLMMSHDANILAYARAYRQAKTQNLSPRSPLCTATA